MTQLDQLYHNHIEHLQAKYAAILQHHQCDAVLIHSGAPRSRSSHDDQSWSLRVTPHFGHWLPLQAADCVLRLAPGQRPLLCWCQPGSFWEGPPAPEHRLFEKHFDIQVIRSLADLAPLLPAGKLAWVADSRDAPPDDRLQRHAELERELDELRVHKTAYEVACIAEANARAAAGHDELRRAFAAGGNIELELHLRYLLATSQDDPETPYKNIVALGEHAAVLHHVAYGRGTHHTDATSLLLDAGATCMGYHADITRTWVRGHGASKDLFLALVSGVERLQQQLCDGAVVGRPYQDLHDESHLRIGQLLRELGVVRAGPEEAVAKDVTFAFYPHGLGHSLGLQTHDVGCARIAPRADNPWLRNTRIIESGQVFTIEPGVYFIPGLLEPLRQGPHGHLVDWQRVEALAPFGGVRIEDDLHIGTRAADNLTRIVLPSGGGVA
ncbi:MAG: Xaa-Pro dipeptidase [Deltaproteobacteria bacterium]|nr:Xaa-Pro dipeptidase [Deltaproteobacteria bacterium]